MKMKKILYTFFATATLLIALSSCHGSRTATSGDDTLSSGSRQTPFDMAKVIESAPSGWTTLQVPLTIELNSPASFKAGAKAYMTRDSSIYFSFTILGMEMAAVQITNDSIFGVDKMHKRYIAESLSSITANYPVSISTLQSMFTGQLFLPGVTNLTDKNVKEFRLKSSGDGMDAVPVKQFDPFVLSFHFSPDDMLECCQVKSDDTSFAILYSDPVETTLGTLPMNESLSVNRNKLSVNATLIWNWRKVRIDNPSDNKKIKINPTYQRVSALQLLKTLI
ncbi:MAG: DUF4292 domain-containing protein [Muribaculaceae bacterium]|nr:DUF4292 domain-containing protein [Muribaculaceae bacterium]